MARDEAGPWARGETHYNGGTIGTNPPINYEGREYLFEVNAPDGYGQQDTSGRQPRVKVALNASTIALKPGHIARYKPSTAPLECIVDGYWAAAADMAAGVVDEFLPPAGVPPGDLFYLVVDGPTSILTVTTGLTSLAIGDRIELATGTSATNDDAGRINKIAATPAVADLLALVGRSEQVQASANAMTKCVVHFLAGR